MLRQQATFKRQLSMPVKVFYVGGTNKYDGVFVLHHAIKQDGGLAICFFAAFQLKRNLVLLGCGL